MQRRRHPLGPRLHPGGPRVPLSPRGKKGGRGVSSAPNPRILTASALPPMPRDLIHTSGGASSRRFRTCGSNRGALGAKGSRAVKTPKLAHFRPQSAPSAPEGAHPLGLRGSSSAPEGEPHRAPRGPEGTKASGVERVVPRARSREDEIVQRSPSPRWVGGDANTRDVRGDTRGRVAAAIRGGASCCRLLSLVLAPDAPHELCLSASLVSWGAT